MKSYYEIDNFITAAERSYFLSLMDRKFINHKSTRTGIKSSLNYFPIEFRGINRVSIMKMYPNTEQSWHTDGVNLKRNSLIIHPITDNYAPFSTRHGTTSSTVIVNTQEEHAVFNNEYTRLNLQIPIDLPFEELINNKDNAYWKIIKGLYN